MPPDRSGSGENAGTGRDVRKKHADHIRYGNRQSRTDQPPERESVHLITPSKPLFYHLLTGINQFRIMRR